MFKVLFTYNTLFYFSMFFLFGLNTSYSQNILVKSKIKSDSLIKKSIQDIRFNGADGPYIIGDTLYRINGNNNLIKEVSYPKDSIFIEVNNADKDAFYVALKQKHTSPKTIYKQPKKMVVISDIEGNYNAFTGFLYSNCIIDANHNWIFGDGHLVLVGDFVDRGENVTQVLWLIYKLEQQAEAQKGQVHFILGNHEVLNFQGDHRYNRDKYIKAARVISGEQNKKQALKYLYSNETELGKWLATKNVVEKIGDYIFVHAGLSPELLDYKISLVAINIAVRSNYRVVEGARNKLENFLYSSKGPFWYRGLVMDKLKYSKIEAYQLQVILNYYDAQKIVIGHTPVKFISTDFKGKVIRTDVSHDTKKFSTETQGLLVENGKAYVIDAMNNTFELLEAY